MRKFAWVLLSFALVMTTLVFGQAVPTITADTVADLVLSQTLQYPESEGSVSVKTLAFLDEAGSQLIAGYSIYADGDYGYTFVTWDTITGEMLSIFAPKWAECEDTCLLQSLTAVQVGDETRIAAGISDGYYDVVLMFDVEGNLLDEPISVSQAKYDRIVDLAFTPDGKILAIGMENASSVPTPTGSVIYWDVEAGKQIWSTSYLLPISEIITNEPKALLALAGGSLLDSQPLPIEVFDYTQGKFGLPQQAYNPGHATSINTIAFSADGGYIASGDGDEFSDFFQLNLWQVDQTSKDPLVGLQIEPKYEATPPLWGGISSLAFSPDDTLLTVGIFSGETWFYTLDSLLNDSASAEPVLKITGGHNLQYSADGTLFAATGLDSADIHLYRVAE